MWFVEISLQTAFSSGELSINYYGLYPLPGLFLSFLQIRNMKILIAESTDVCDSTELMKMVMEQEWDIIISDINMPPGDSTIENIKKIKEHSPTTPVIILTMHSAKDYAVRAIKAGASGFLQKGSATKELITAVNQVMSGKKYLSTEVA